MVRKAREKKDAKTAEKKPKTSKAKEPKQKKPKQPKEKKPKEPKRAKKISKNKEGPKRKAETLSNEKILDLALICDCTGSMQKWIDRTKVTLNQIIDNILKEHKDMKVRVSFVGYRDFNTWNNIQPNEKYAPDHFEIKDFTEDITDVKNFI